MDCSLQIVCRNESALRSPFLKAVRPVVAKIAGHVEGALFCGWSES